MQGKVSTSGSSQDHVGVLRRRGDRGDPAFVAGEGAEITQRFHGVGVEEDVGGGGFMLLVDVLYFALAALSVTSHL